MPLAERLVMTLASASLAVAPHANACTISTTAVAFGTYLPTSSSPRDGTGTIELLCPLTVLAPQVALGTGSSGTYSPRSMASGASQLNYNLYTTAARTTVWGNGSSGTSALTLSGPTLSGLQWRYTRTIYGRIPPVQNVSAGTYGDTLVVTVTF